MKIALICIASASLITSACSLAILIKTARELKRAQSEVQTLKAKALHNAKLVGAAIQNMQF